MQLMLVVLDSAMRSG